MKLVPRLAIFFALVLPALAGPSAIPWNDLPACVRNCIHSNRQHVQIRFPEHLYYWCEETGPSRLKHHGRWDEFGRRFDKCKVASCITVDEWYDAAQWQWDNCGRKYETGDTMGWFNNWRESTWWPNMGVKRPATGEGWIEGVGGG